MYLYIIQKVLRGRTGGIGSSSHSKEQLTGASPTVSHKWREEKHNIIN